MPVVVANRTVEAGYYLVELWTSIWPHIREIGPGKAFSSAMDYQGERCAVFDCPRQFGGNWEGNEGAPPGEPWAQPGGNGVSAVGDQFFDPAYTMSKRLSFPPPFSLQYCFNPYLGVADSCAAAADGGTPDAGGTTDGGAADSGPAQDAGSDGGGETGRDGGADGGPGDGGSPPASAAAGCSLGGGASPSGALSLLALALALAARRRSRLPRR
jgi:MYXO-CTERM domain-containing protein